MKHPISRGLIEARVQADHLLKDLKSEDHARQRTAAERFLILPHLKGKTAEVIDVDQVKKKHARRVIAMERGFHSWEECAQALNQSPDALTEFAAEVAEYVDDKAVYIAIMPIINEDGRESYHLEVELTGHELRAFDTATFDLPTARREADRLQKALEKNSLVVFERREDWEEWSGLDGMYNPVPAGIFKAFVRAGYVLDEAESTEECVGFSQFIDCGEDEAYSFGVVDQKGVQVYSAHPDFSQLPKGEHEGIEADGVAHLSFDCGLGEAAVLSQKLEALIATTKKHLKPAQQLTITVYQHTPQSVLDEIVKAVGSEPLSEYTTRDFYDLLWEQRDPPSEQVLKDLQEHYGEYIASIFWGDEPAV